MKNQGWISLGGLVFILNSSHVLAQLPVPTPAVQPGAPGEGLRLIETAPDQISWMTPDEVKELARRAHETGHCGGFMDITETAARPNLSVRARLAPLSAYPDPHHVEYVNDLLSEISPDRLISVVSQLSNKFNNRFLKSPSGVQAAEWIRDRFRELSNKRADVTVELFKHAKFAQPSVIAKIRGAGPHANEHVILGAHEDSINWQGGSPGQNDRAPGADDDASGVATIIEAFRVLIDADYRPDRTLVFVAYAGEEMGLLGSRDVAASFADQGIHVVGVQQFDMTLYPGNEPQIAIISDFTNQAHNRFTEKLLDTYVQVAWTEEPCGYACSDHASWTREGFPASFAFEAPDIHSNGNIHTTRDTVDQLTPSWGLHYAKLAVAYAVELGSPDGLFDDGSAESTMGRNLFR